MSGWPGHERRKGEPDFRDEIHTIAVLVRDQQRLHADVLNGVHELAVKLETLVAALNERCPQREKDIQRLADAVAALIKDSKERDTKMSNRVTGIETVKHRVGGIWLVLGGTLTFLAGLLAMWIGKQF